MFFCVLFGKQMLYFLSYLPSHKVQADTDGCCDKTGFGATLLTFKCKSDGSVRLQPWNERLRLRNTARHIQFIPYGFTFESLFRPPGRQSVFSSYIKMHYYLLQKVGLNLTVAEHTLNFPRALYESCGEKLWPEIAALAFEPTHFPFLTRRLVLLSKAPCMLCAFILLRDSLDRKRKILFHSGQVTFFFLPLRLSLGASNQYRIHWMI